MTRSAWPPERYETVQTAAFSKWLLSLERDLRGKVLTRIARLRKGNPGHVGPARGGISELKDTKADFRVYYREISGNRYLLLFGGNKASQHRDIEKAHSYWAEYQKEVDKTKSDARRKGKGKKGND